MKDVNMIVFDRDTYSSEAEFENEIKKAVMMLLNAGYIVTVKYDANDKGMGIVRIDYNYAEQEYGAHYPHWLSPEEFESVIWDNEE